MVRVRHVRSAIGAFSVMVMAMLTVFVAPQSIAATPAPPATNTASVHAGPGSVSPMSATGCNQDVCISLIGPNNGYVTVEAWADSYNFYGTMKFTYPQGGPKYAGPQTWFANKGNYAYIVQSAIVGEYCVEGYDPDGTVYGKPCEYVK